MSVPQEHMTVLPDLSLRVIILMVDSSVCVLLVTRKIRKKLVNVSTLSN